MIWLGVDPGVTTGVSLIEVTDDELPRLLWSGQYLDAYKGIILGLQDIPTVPDRMVVEDFILRRGKAFSSDQTAPERGIGVCATYAHMWDVRMDLLSPAQNKSIPDSALKTLNLWGAKGHENRHQRDASRLIVRMLKADKHLPTLRAVYPNDD